MNQFKFWNQVCGWITFIIAAFTYLSTMEPTASFWDCPEFIATAFKLDVGHPPGAPFFMLLGHFFTLFASDVTQVAKMVNSLSALASAFTILFLFWTITLMAKKVISPAKDSEYSPSQILSVMGAGVIGALSFAFSDTFWFSAVEGEVYASSSLFTAIVFWAILKWDECADEPYANRWLILIAYLMGLSIGVHLLNLLAIPAIALVYYYRKYNVNVKGTLIALGISFLILLFMMYGIIPGIVMVASWFELLFVNSFGLPFNSGFAFYLLVLVLILVTAIFLTYRKEGTTLSKLVFVLGVTMTGMPFVAGNRLIGFLLIAALLVYLFRAGKVRMDVLNTVLLAVTMVVVGYSSYSVIVIRSAANPPMDQNSPDNVFTLKSYLNREQYGDRPLFYGPFFYDGTQDPQSQYQAMYGTDIHYLWEKIPSGGWHVKSEAKDVVWSAKEKIDSTEKDRYVVTDTTRDYQYVPEYCTVFPRMYSSDANHISAYKEWSGFDGYNGRQIRFNTFGQPAAASIPSFGQNVKFFIGYQVLYMYMRYFMWNFSGRQNDIQGYGQVNQGMCLTGIPFIDSLFEGDYENLPSDMKENRGRNVYFMLPLLLGILGLAYQLAKGSAGKQSFWLTFVFFFMTGLAIVLYLNQTPYQPRERDYAYAGSFYAFGIWIGFGVLGVMTLLRKVVKNPNLTAVFATLLCLFVPARMASENWDDHDRSNRYTCRDFGYNYLMSCAPNAVIFTNGDNDTFPLWYLQEVEGVRTDVRVCNLSYLQTDWYIDQMRRDAYDSKALPISWKRYQYVQGTRDVANVEDVVSEMDAKEAIQNYLLNDDVNLIPSRNLNIPVNVEAYRKEHPDYVGQEDTLMTSLTLHLGRRLYKHEEMILEMLSQNNWERPIYFSCTVGESYYMGLRNNFQQEGLAYRIVPMQKEGGIINTNLMYDNMMNKFRWGGLDSGKDIYLDETNLRMCHTFRAMFYILADALLQESNDLRGKNDQLSNQKREMALKVLDRCQEVLPDRLIPNDYTSIQLGRLYYRLGSKAKGAKLFSAMGNLAEERINWVENLPAGLRVKSSVRNVRDEALVYLDAIVRISSESGDKQFEEKYASLLNHYLSE